jgi:hypothetical protein
VDLIFQGFQSSLPVWVYLLIFIGTSLLAWWSYRQISGIRKSYRYILIAIRTAVFFILLLLLLNPFFKAESPYYEQPRILMMLDNSESTAVEKSNYQGVESYHQVLDQLNLDDSSSVDYDFFSIGNETTPSNLNKLTFDANQTNLSTAVQSIQGNQSDASAAVIISDGIFTKGQNPVFEAANLNIPVFAIGLGDTTFQKDVLVSSVSTNSSGYLNSTQPVTATISSKGFQGTSFPVELRKGNEVIATQTITPEISNSTQEITFELQLQDEGLQQYKIEIPNLSEEWTNANNIQRFSVDVKDDKQQILSLAFEVHPDVKLVRSLLLADQNTNLTSRTWIQGDKFIEGNFAFDTDTLDLAIIHGYPQSGLSGTVQQKLAELGQNIPIVIAATPMFSPQRFDQQVTSLPLSVSGSWDNASVSVRPEVESTAHPIMELPVVTYDRLPRLSAPIENIATPPGATALLSSMFQGNDTQKPVLVVQELGNRRLTVVTGFGWFRLDQNDNSETRAFVQQLWSNIVSWTATDPENQLLDVQPTQTSFDGSEPVVINAYLTNERGQVESDATIEMSVASDSMDARFYSMENKGAGQYQLDLGTMPEGIYSFEATAQKGDRTIETQNGEFAVASSNAEFLNTNRNDQLLRQLSERSGGEYVPFDSVSGFWDRLDQRGLLDQQQEIRTTFFYPYRYIGWFIAVLLLLCGEWIFRKYLSLP